MGSRKIFDLQFQVTEVLIDEIIELEQAVIMAHKQIAHDQAEIESLKADLAKLQIARKV